MRVSDSTLNLDAEKFKEAWDAAKKFNKTVKTGEGELVYAPVVEDKKGSEETEKEGEEKKPAEGESKE